MDIDGQELSNHIQGLKKYVSAAVKRYLKENPVDDPDKVGFFVAHATTVIAALYVQEAGGSKAQFLQACETQWNWVKQIFDLKKAYDNSTPEERQAVINGDSAN